MIAQLGAAFLTGVPSWDGRMLEASSVSASEGQSLRVRFGERMKQQWDESVEAPAELGAHKVA